MATWQVEQKVEVWYQTEVVADTLEQAIELANDSGDWVRLDDTEWTDDYYAKNTDTEDEYTLNNRVWTKEQN